MNKLLGILIGFVSLITVSSCDTAPQFGPPPYDAVGNLAIDRVKIDAYLDTARIDSLYRIHDPSGVIIIVQQEGIGSRPIFGSVIYTDFTGSLMSDGSVFDTSYEQVAIENDIFVEGRTYNTLSFVLGSARITGWDLAFARLRPRSRARLIIPSLYGNQNSENDSRIPSNSVLVFDIEFRGID